LYRNLKVFALKKMKPQTIVLEEALSVAFGFG